MVQAATSLMASRHGISVYGMANASQGRGGGSNPAGGMENRSWRHSYKTPLQHLGKDAPSNGCSWPQTEVKHTFTFTFFTTSLVACLYTNTVHYIQFSSVQFSCRVCFGSC
jgi:hypothetical protein